MYLFRVRSNKTSSLFQPNSNRRIWGDWNDVMSQFTAGYVETIPNSLGKLPACLFGTSIWHYGMISKKVMFSLCNWPLSWPMFLKIQRTVVLVSLLSVHKGGLQRSNCHLLSHNVNKSTCSPQRSDITSLTFTFFNEELNILGSYHCFDYSSSSM